MASRDSYTAAYRDMLAAASELGLPDDTARLIASQLRSEIGLRRMASYMRGAHPKSMADIADEMVAIMDARDAWIRKKQAEEANSRYNEWLNSDLRENAD